MAQMPETIIIHKTSETKTAVEYSIVEPKTNADRIRAMSDEELAKLLFERGNCGEYCYGICSYQDECNGYSSDNFCISKIVEWMKKEVKE